MKHTLNYMLTICFAILFRPRIVCKKQAGTYPEWGVLFFSFDTSMLLLVCLLLSVVHGSLIMKFFRPLSNCTTPSVGSIFFKENYCYTGYPIMNGLANDTKSLRYISGVVHLSILVVLNTISIGIDLKNV